MNIRLIIFVVSVLLSSFARSQEEKEYELLGGPCEGCEAVLEFKGDLTSVDTLPEFDSAESKLKITGTIFENDGKTPAENVVLYIHHTNAKGIYPTKGDEKGWADRHGYLRGWIKTANDGRYTFYTQVPASYPNRRTPAHIHLLVLEPDGRYYYLSDYFFKGDPLLTDEHQQDPPRGGDGVLELQNYNGMKLIERDLILGKAVPGYE
ncbi:intradiol ring-cleavage dioxygenase [Gramella lutea]|uniref:Intradiol ring-cleavage dioxygenase n=1 Tax=Christiangramia lutea TaxID=1607951 RepID=A0A9X1V1N0_9FLAO|nr:intradiol ring-cleavage dioxygenase [Christiangramia lutea]MCH4822697.1 intradiol ring-cleavage dioxygenase [Christiangramia lutea]